METHTELTHASSPKARQVQRLLERLQEAFAAGLNHLEERYGSGVHLTRVRWLRDAGRHGGGHRLEISDSDTINRASLNVSGIHYDDMPDKVLASATALSCIVHPQHPLAPSLHMHRSWTELRQGRGGWRIMADLNPALPHEGARQRFLSMLEGVFANAPHGTLAAALAQGDRYFKIPALNRHRGVVHLYLEQWRTEDEQQDEALVRRVGQEVIDTYLSLVQEALKGAQAPSSEELAAQLEYHTVYLFQVLTLDRGTSSGLLVHNQNDLGILGSLPNRVDRALLASWIARMPAPQDALLQGIVNTLEAQQPSTLSAQVRAALAKVVRTHYQAHPEALALQARGHILPPTVANHGDRRAKPTAYERASTPSHQGSGLD